MDPSETTDHIPSGESTEELTQAGTVMGTPAYMAPEQARGEAIDALADVFALGGILCAILTGQPPFTGKSSLEVLQRAQAADLADAHARLDGCGADPDLLALARRCLSPRPADRPANGQAVADELTAYLNGVQERLHQVELATAESRTRAQEEAKRRRVTLAAGGAVLLVLSAGVIVSGWFAIKAREEAHEASRQAIAAGKAEKKAQERAEAEAQAKKLAAANAESARNSEATARRAEQVARAEEEAGRKLLYTTDMQLAPFVWGDDRTTAQKLRALLSKHIPEERMKDEGGRMNETGQKAASSLIFPPSSFESKPDLRGFEWHYYQHLLEDSAAVLKGHATPVITAAFTSNGQLVTLDQDGQARRWDLDSQAEDKASRRELKKGGIAAVRVLSSDGRLAALAEGDKVYVVETSTGREHFQIESTPGPSRRLLFNPDGGRLVVFDERIRWCDVASGQVIASVYHGLNGGNSLALSADGLTLAVIGHGLNSAQYSIFRLDTRTRKVTPQTVNTGGTMRVAALSGDGRLLAANYPASGWLRVFDAPTGRPIAQHGSAHSSPIAAMAFTGESPKLATADVEGTIKIWEDARKLNSKSAASMTKKGHEAAITHLGFSRDGKQLVSTSADKTARVWEMDHTGTAIRVLERAGGGCFSARFSPDGQWIAAAVGGSVRLWDAATGKLVRDLSPGEQRPVSSVAFSPADVRLLAAGYGGEADGPNVALLDIDAGTELARLPAANDLAGHDPGKLSVVVSALAFSPDGRISGRRPGLAESLQPCNFCQSALGLGGRHAPTDPALEGTHGLLYFSRILQRRKAAGQRQPRRDCDPLVDRIMESDPNPAESRSGVDLQPSRAEVQDVAFSPDGKTLALASRQGTVQFWEAATGKLMETLKGHSSAVNALAFSPDGRTLASGGTDQTIRLWNVETRRELLQLDRGGVELDRVQTLRFAPDGRHLLAGGLAIAFWSTAPVVWNDPDRGALSLRVLLNSKADFQSRIRMLSENLRLHAALEKLDSNDLRVAAALAAAQANWHASRQAWPQATQAFDRLVAVDRTTPGAWLRTPGLLRLARALVEENRPRDAAALLVGGASRRAADGLPPAVDGELLLPLRAAINERLARDPPNPGLLELRAELAGQWSDAKAQLADYTAAIEALSRQNPEPAADLRRLYGRRGHAEVALQQWQQAEDDFARIVSDATTDDSLLSDQALAQADVLLERKPGAIAVAGFPLRLAHEQLVSVARKIIDPWSKLAAAYRLHGDQPAIGKLAASRPQAASAIGDLFAADKQWERAIEIYSTAISKRTTDVLLLWKRARAFEALKNWDGAAADWSRAASGNPEGAKLLAEFARRLAAGGKASLANDQFEKARALYERSLDADPENDVVATELAEMLLAMHANDPGRLKRRANRFALLKATDPWLKLAVAYAVSGRNDAAVQYFGRALQRANGDEARKPIVELAARFDDVLIVLAERQPDLAPLQLALARKLAERGKQRLAQKQPAEAGAVAESTRDSHATARNRKRRRGLRRGRMKPIKPLGLHVAWISWTANCATSSSRWRRPRPGKARSTRPWRRSPRRWIWPRTVVAKPGSSRVWWRWPLPEEIRMDRRRQSMTRRKRGFAVWLSTG